MRQIQVSLAAASREELLAAVGEERLLSAVPDQLDETRTVFNLLAPNDQSEAVLDQLQKHFGSQPGFRVVLLPVEATLPRVEEAAPSPGKSARARDRINREELYQDILAGSRIGTTFIWMTLLSSVVAAIGLYRDDTVVLIGAMVIAPLLTPNMALCLATTLGDASLAVKALKTNATGFCLSLTVAVVIGLFVNIEPEAPAIAARSAPTLPDLALALASGAAGALAFTTSVPSALIGVMVAVALMPPLVAFGLLLGSGEFAAALGPLTLLATNVICVNLAGVLTFVAQGVQPRTWWEAQRARRATIRSGIVWVSLLILLVALFWFQGSASA